MVSAPPHPSLEAMCAHSGVKIAKMKTYSFSLSRCTFWDTGERSLAVPPPPNAQTKVWLGSGFSPPAPPPPPYQRSPDE